MSSIDDIFKIIGKMLNRKKRKMLVKLTPEEISNIEQISIRKIAIENKIDDIKLESDILDNDKRVWWKNLKSKYHLPSVSMTYDNGEIIEILDEDEK